MLVAFHLVMNLEFQLDQVVFVNIAFSFPHWKLTETG